MKRPWIDGVAAATALALAFAAASCAKSSQQPKQLTERERDSTIGASQLPGSGVVSKSLEVSDSAAARAKAMDAQAGSSGQ